MTEDECVRLKKLGEKIRRYRQEKGYSQEQFAELSSLDRTYVSGLERGIRNPSYLILQRILLTLNISSNNLFSEEE